MEPYYFLPGDKPILISVPHCGLDVPAEIAERFTPEAMPLPDTDWHVDRLYEFAHETGASLLMARTSRYVIDFNRAPDDQPLYPQANNTELCPTTTFDDAAIYRSGEAPGAEEVEDRRERFWRPYHARLAAELEKLRQEHGIVILWDGHSIRSHVPRFFEGELPHFNIGSDDGHSASAELVGLLTSIARESEVLDYTHVVNGRFKGGYITRHYGAPGNKVHAVQLELAQRTYMDETPPYRYDPVRAAHLRPVLRAFLETALAWAEIFEE